MSSISSPHPNPYPKISQPSNSTTKPKNKDKNKRTPNWLELPEDIWSLIISKLYTIHIIENVQNVCMLFRQICEQPSMFKIVNMTIPDDYMHSHRDFRAMTRLIVDRSSGCLVDIYLENMCDEDTLMYIAERSKNLKHLRLGYCRVVSGEGLIEAIKRLPVLEEVEIIKCLFSGNTIEAIGHACPSLKSLSLNDVGSRDHDLIVNEDALAIAKSMPNLHNLRLIRSWMTNEGLKAVLDGCPLLESLELRACFLIDLSGDLGNRCKKIKHLRVPFDSTADYSHEAYTDNEEDLRASLDFDDSHLFGIYNEDSGVLRMTTAAFLDEFDDFPCYNFVGNGYH